MTERRRKAFPGRTTQRLTDSIGFVVFLQIVDFNRQEKEQIDPRAKPTENVPKRDTRRFAFLLNIRISEEALPVPFDRSFQQFESLTLRFDEFILVNSSAETKNIVR